MARPVDDVDLEGALSRVPCLVVGHVSDVVGSPLERHVRLEASQIDHLHLLTTLIVEDRLVPSYHGRPVAGSEPNVTLKSHHHFQVESISAHISEKIQFRPCRPVDQERAFYHLPKDYKIH